MSSCRRGRTRRLLLLVAQVFALCLFAAACSRGAKAPSSDSPPASVLAQPIDRSALVIALRKIRTAIAPEDDAFVVNAHTELVERCMAAKGFKFKTGRVSPIELQGEKGFLARIDEWLFDNDGEAAKVGYSRFANVSSDQRRPDAKASVSGVETTPQFTRAFFGDDSERVEVTERDGSSSSVPGGGCMGFATEKIWGNIREYLRLRDARTSAESDLWTRTIGSRPVSGTVVRWRGCLRDKGYKFDDPIKAVHQARDVGLSSTEGIAIAVADANCKKKTDLSRVFANSFLFVADKVEAEYEALLLAAAELEGLAVDRAKSALQGT